MKTQPESPPRTAGADRPSLHGVSARRDQPGVGRPGYFVVSEPEGVHLVAARTSREARALVFESIKDSLRGEPEQPEPYTMAELHARRAAPEDLHVFEALRLLPPQPPRRSCQVF
jgi:hypothetical protein